MKEKDRAHLIVHEDLHAAVKSACSEMQIDMEDFTPEIILKDDRVREAYERILARKKK
jgi:hypothetical protein